MSTYADGHEGVSTHEFGEWLYGLGEPAPEDFRDLFLGPSDKHDESDEQRAARLEAAAEVLAELLEESETDEISLLNALYATQLSSIAPLRFMAGVEHVTQARSAA